MWKQVNIIFLVTIALLDTKKIQSNLVDMNLYGNEPTDR